MDQQTNGLMEGKEVGSRRKGGNMKGKDEGKMNRWMAREPDVQING